MLLIAIDTETTGLDTSTADLVQVAAVDSHGKVLMNSLCFPLKGDIPEEASNVHGITIDQVNEMPLDVDVAKALLSVVSQKSLEHDLTLITYNGAHYDLPLLKKKNCDLSAYKHVDVYHLVQRDLHMYGLKLSEVYEGYLGNPLENAHDATADCRACIDIFDAYCVDNAMNYDEVIKYMENPKVLEAMPFGKHKGTNPRFVPKGYLRWMHENMENLSPDMAFTLSVVLT